MAAKQFDIVIVGSGPGGYTTAVRAAQLGMSVAIVEREKLGGICLNWGCIPTKALLKSAEVMHTLNHLADYGFSADNIRFDLDKIVQRSRGIAGRMENGVKFLMKKNKVEVVEGTARLDGPGRLVVEKSGAAAVELKAKHIVLATGARARTFPGMEPDGELVVTYRDALVPKSMPKKLLVIGSGAIGIEFASFYRTLGAEVTVVELLDRILPAEDEEVSAFARRAFEKQKMRIVTGAKVTKLDKGQGTVTASIEKDGKTEQLVVDRVIVAVGIVGNTEGLGLEKTEVKIERGQIVVDEYLRTGEPGLYAIGDVTGGPWLAHKASHEGVICVEKIAGLPDVHPMKTTDIPGCTYCTPQIASVGLSERKAKEAGHEVKVGRFPFAGNGKAVALGEAEGFVKTVFDAKTGELLGAHMIGAEVTEMIQGYTVAKSLETTEAELMHTVFPHPTLSEMMHESVLDAYGRAINI